MQSPELDFQEWRIMFLSVKVSLRSKYFFADPNVIVTPPDKAHHSS